MITREPGDKPKPTPELLAAAQEMPMRIVQVTCMPAGATADDLSGVSFLAIADFLPRVGEHIVTQDGKPCRVISVSYRVAPIGDPSKPSAFGLFPHVYAVLKQPTQEPESS